MKKIIFNDKFGLTKAVLEGRKTQTRRIFASKSTLLPDDCKSSDSYSYYKVGETVAIAQSYKDCGLTNESMKSYPAWVNKMFVKADVMPHHIKIERVRIERLQDISEENCVKEGVCFHENPPVDHKYDLYTPWPYDVKPYRYDIDNVRYFCKARFAYAHLIDKINGKGTWASNPWVFVYDFKLIK